MIDKFLIRWGSVSTNALYGITKSVIAYVFLIAIYKISDDSSLIQSYIDYEVWCAGSILITLGIQGRAYKTMEIFGLKILAVFLFSICVIVFVSACLFEWMDIYIIVSILVFSDRLLDVQLQVERQNNRYDIYNRFDVGNSVLVKCGFLAYLLGLNIWIYICTIKLLVSVVFFVRQYTEGDFGAGIKDLKHMFSEFPKWVEWYLFDVLNFAVMNLDLVLIRLVGTEQFVASYFYVRKFLKLPLVLLNYIIDPLYVAIRALPNIRDGGKMIIEILVPVYWASFSVFYGCVLWFYISFEDSRLAFMGLLMALTSYYSLIARFGDLVVLIFRPQRDRIILRFLCLSGVVALLLSGSSDLLLILTASFIPVVGWVIASKFIFSVKFSENVIQMGFISIGYSAAIIFQKFDFGLSNVCRDLFIFSMIGFVGCISAFFGLRQLKRIVLSVSST